MGELNRISRRARGILGALGALAIVGSLSLGPAAAPAAAAGVTTSVTALDQAVVNPKPVGRATTITATVTGDAGTPTGTVALFEGSAGGTAIGSPVALASGTADLPLASDLAAGTYHLVAVYGGDDAYASSESASVDFVVGPRPSSTLLSVSGPHDSSGTMAQKGDVLTVTANVADAGPSQVYPMTGNVAIKVDGTTVRTIAANTSTTLSTSALTVTTHTISAVYTGTTDYATSSAQHSISIVTNVVEASGVGVQYATFYPAKDGYRDTDAIRGRRAESAKVDIRIYNPAGTRIKTASIATAVGSYSYAWNGRKSDGTLLAAGKYKIVQTLTDTVGAKKVVTNYVNLSHKKLYTYTATYTKNPTQTSRSTSTWAGWSFTLPSATIYKGLTFYIYGRDTLGTGGFGPQDFTQCSSSYWSPNCVTRWKTFPTSYAWKGVTGSVTKDRSGRTVRLYAWGGYGNTVIKYGRVKVTYQVLK